jgi:hypothetical protein
MRKTSMARLTKIERLELQARWLDFWRKAGCPAFTEDDPLKTSSLEPMSILVCGSTRQTYGYATKLIVSWSGNADVTWLLSQLTGYRLCKDRTMACRSGCASEKMDKAVAWQLARNVHEDAALAHRDVDALRACNKPLSIVKEAEWMRTWFPMASAPSQPSCRL